MNETDLERRLSSWYGKVDAESAPPALHERVEAIPDGDWPSDADDRPAERRRGLLLAAAALAVGAVGWVVFQVGGPDRTSLNPTPDASPVIQPSGGAPSGAAPSDVAPSGAVPSVAVPSDAAPAVTPGPTTTTSGVAETPLGRLAWTQVEGDATSIPIGEVMDGADGSQIVIEGAPYRSEGARIWRLVDGAWRSLGELQATEGAVHHAVVDGQILVWDEGFTVWQGPELEPIELGFLRPRPVQGVEWTNEGDQALAFGGQVILPSTVYGRVLFDELFDVPPGLAGQLVAENEDDPEKTSNKVGETYVVRAGSEIVGRFRVELRDSTLAVMVDADRGNTLMQLDAMDLGVDPESVWRGMYIGRIHGPNTGAMLTAGERQPFSPPTPFTYIREQLPTYAVLDSRLVELTVLEIPNQSERHTLVSVWTSPDGFDWARQPDARLDGRLITDLRLRPDLQDAARGDLVAEVAVDQAFDLTTMAATSDGIGWGTMFELPGSSEPEASQRFVGTRIGAGFLDLTGSTVLASTNGRDWVAVEGLPAIYVWRDGLSDGGSLVFRRDPNTITLSEDFDGRRVLWTITLEQPG